MRTVTDIHANEAALTLDMSMMTRYTFTGEKTHWITRLLRAIVG